MDTQIINLAVQISFQMCWFSAYLYYCTNSEYEANNEMIIFYVDIPLPSKYFAVLEKASLF